MKNIYNPHTMTGDKPPSAEFLNALRVYRSPDDAEMSLSDQFRVIADRIEEDKPRTIEQDLADSPRYRVDGKDKFGVWVDLYSADCIDGPYAIFDTDKQTWATETYRHIVEAVSAAMRANAAEAKA